MSEREEHLPLNCLGSCLRNRDMWAVVSQLVYTVIYRGTHMGCVAWGVWHTGKNGALVRRLVKTCFRLCFWFAPHSFWQILHELPERSRQERCASREQTDEHVLDPQHLCAVHKRMGNSWWGRAGSSQKDGGGNSRSRCSLFVEADVPSFKKSHLAMPSWKRCEESGDGARGEKVTSAGAVRREPIAADRLIINRPLLKIGRVPLRVPQVATRVIRSDNLLQNECG